MASGQRRVTSSVEAFGSGHLLRPLPRGPARVYLSRDISTVQLWEKREGMPVHRHLHDKIGSVYAYPSELDSWWQSAISAL